MSAKMLEGARTVGASVAKFERKSFEVSLLCVRHVTVRVEDADSRGDAEAIAIENERRRGEHVQVERTSEIRNARPAA